MNSAKIFLVGQGQDKVLLPMTETPYSTEEVLQQLLARYPDLIPGDQITPAEPRRWLLIAREMGVPRGDGESNRWSLDHLFLDQDGVPTFIECKRASDTRVRREVVAQMLDYAANGIEYWGLDRLRQAATETATSQGKHLDELVAALLGSATEEADIDGYWETVAYNLQAGQVRLIFVADEIPAELRRLVEFLNERLLDVEVLAVEVKQFRGEGQQALVPRVVGLTESSRRLKRGGSNKHSDQATFLSQVPPLAAPTFAYIFDQARAQGHTLYWGKKGFSLRVPLRRDHRLVSYLYGWPEGHLEFYFGYLPLPEEDQIVLRKQLMAFELFRPAGEKTLRTQVDQQDPARLHEMFTFVLQFVNEMARAY